MKEYTQDVRFVIVYEHRRSLSSAFRDLFFMLVMLGLLLVGVYLWHLFITEALTPATLLQTAAHSFRTC